jgi:hypothetical protein
MQLEDRSRDYLEYLSEADIFHEVGHMVIGIEIGLIEDCIRLTDPTTGNKAQAHYSRYRVKPDKLVQRSLSGILSVLEFRPSYFPEALRMKLVEGAVDTWFDENSPHREFLNEAREDFLLALQDSETAVGKDPTKVFAYLRRQEKKVRKLLASEKQRRAIPAIVEDFKFYFNEEWKKQDPDELVIYRAARAKRVLESTDPSA